ncbi:protein phosphatase 1 regulatory subunit 16A [Paragonimus westermani]|uniref:Protein phosphatase 1 regulatory subunit 16A n=1 Tax=Paragonimus westermani TaxID=34504 RepID=A0A5J4P068_9TREM|nr:protein phosphatase 1 regulatory subunit 16A [Paragonimus westermani]
MDGPSLVEPNGIMPGLIPEMPQVRVPDLERIRNARNRRKLQIKEWQKYDRKMMNESDKLQRKGLSPPSERGFFRAGHSVKFPPSLIFLEAAARGDLDEVRKLLSSGVCPDVANEDGLTALHQQMYRFTAEEAAELRMCGISDAQGCCIDNTPEMCRLLLRFGANANARDTERWTPLHAAATCHHTELCSILINNGADLLAMNADGNMPYECCMPGPTLTLIETEMDKRGITQEQLDDLHRLPECDMLADMEVLYKAGADLNSLDAQGASYLHIASACGYEEVAIFLLKHGAKIDLLDRDGWQAIHIAACWDHMEIIEVLVNFGADIMAETITGETVFDICEDLEMHSRLMELKQEMERKQTMEQDAHNRADKPRELVRRRSSTNTRSASIRRTSMREKKMISWKEAKQEAEMRGLSPVTLGVDAESGVNDTEVPITPSDMTVHERRLTSPLTVYTANSRGLSAPTSPTDRAHSGKLSEQTKPVDLSNMLESSNNSLKLKSPSPTNRSTNGPMRSANGATSPLTARPPSRMQERNSARPPRTEKPAHNGDQLSSINRRVIDSEHKPNRRPMAAVSSQSEASPFNPISQARPIQRPIGTLESNTITSMSPKPRPRIQTTERLNSHVSGFSGTGSLPRTNNQSEPLVACPSPQIPRHSSGSMSRRRPVGSSSNGAATDDYVSPQLSAHNAYFSPPPTQVINSRTNTTTKENPRPSAVVGAKQKSTRPVIHATASLPRKTNMELIEYDSDPRSSGKCCTLM